MKLSTRLLLLILVLGAVSLIAVLPTSASESALINSVDCSLAQGGFGITISGNPGASYNLFVNGALVSNGTIPGGGSAFVLVANAAGAQVTAVNPSMSANTVTTSCPGTTTKVPHPDCAPLHGGINECVDGIEQPPLIITEGSIIIQFIDPVTGNGSEIFTITDEQIAAVGIPTEFNTPIYQMRNPFTNANFLLSRLTTGEFQVNSSYGDGVKPYIFVWGGELGRYHLALDPNDLTSRRNLTGALERVDSVNPAALAAIFCGANNIHVHLIDSDGQGRPAFFVSREQISTLGIPSVNTLLASGSGLALFRLSSGEFQLNGPKPPGAGNAKILQQQAGDNLVYTVQGGDNLFRLALRFNTTIAAIMAANPEITDATRIFVGQQITIPVGAGTPAGSTAPTITGGGTSLAQQQGFTFIWNGC